ncbi:MAG TPA: hypothetical protein VFG54_20090 [Prolixibacteraceae bacterium]|nr:hypothetical protein [Prolixibacteraceae bacterium]
MKYWKISFYGLGVIPFGFIISLLTFYFQAGRILGYLPRYNLPDPKELALYSVYSPIIDLTGLIWVYSLALWLIAISVYLIVKKEQINWRSIFISTIGHIAAISLFFSGIMEWYAD